MSCRCAAGREWPPPGLLRDGPASGCSRSADLPSRAASGRRNRDGVGPWQGRALGTFRRHALDAAGNSVKGQFAAAFPCHAAGPHRPVRVSTPFKELKWTSLIKRLDSGGAPAFGAGEMTYFGRGRASALGRTPSPTVIDLIVNRPSTRIIGVFPPSYPSPSSTSASLKRLRSDFTDGVHEPDRPAAGRRSIRTCTTSRRPHRGRCSTPTRPRPTNLVRPFARSLSNRLEDYGPPRHRPCVGRRRRPSGPDHFATCRSTTKPQTDDWVE
jgi:hypothetical protein